MGYYVNNEYMEEELRENPPEKVLIDRWAFAQVLVLHCRM